MFHTRFRRFFRLAAIATLLAYLPTNLDLAYAAPALISAETPSPAGWNFDQSFALALPTELARVESIAPGRKGTLLHIQTAHGHYEAQRKIEELLDWLSEKYGDYPVFVEGAAGKLDPARLAFFPNQPDLNFQNARWLAKKALVTGPELYLLKKQSKNGVGIELPESYEKNHAQFKRVLTARGEAKIFSDAFNLAMEKAAAMFSPDLRAFLKRLERHELEVIPLENWMAELQRAALKHLELDLTDTAWQVRWPMLVRFFKIQTLSKRFEPGTYEFEKKIFLAQAKPYLADTKELYKRIEQLLGSAGQSIQLPEPETENAFVEMLRLLPRDFDFKAYSQVTRFAALLILQSEISPSALQGEIRRLETLIAEKLTRNESEKEALKVFSDYRLLEKLLALQLAPADFEKVKDEKQKTELAPSKIAEKLKLEIKSIDKLDRVFEEAIAFYQGAQNRDQVMVRRAENYLKQSSARFSVVITGGFHTEAMREHFEKAGYAYAVATPTISGADEDGYRAYLKAMLADLSQTNLIPNSMIELAQALNPGLGDSTKAAALRATVGRVRAGEAIAPDHSDLDELIKRKKRSAAWGLRRMAPDGSILTPGEIADRSTGAGLSDYEKDFRSEVREAVLPEKSASQSEQVPAHIQSLINDIEKLERSLWPTQFRDLKIALFQNRLNDAAREAESLKPSIRPEHPLAQDVYDRVLALRSESRKDSEKHLSPWLKWAWNLSMVLNVPFVLTAGWFAFQGQASWLMAALFAGLAAFVVTGVVMGVGYLIYRDHQEELDLIHKGAEESRRSLAREKLTRMRLGLTALATLGALAGSPQKADAAFGEEILPSPTNTLNDISKVSGIQSSGHIYSGSIPPTPSPVAFTLNNDRRMTMTANFSGASSGAVAEVNTSFDNPNTPAIESININALSSNGVFRVGLRDANATSGAGVVTLYVDDASGSSDFVFLSGVDNTNRVWEVPISLFDEVNTNQIKAIAFVLFKGSMPNTSSSLSIYFRGHPFVPLLNGSFSPLYDSLAGVSTGTSTAYPPVAVSEVIGGGAITSLVSSTTNFIAHYVLTNSNSVVKVQIDRGTLDEAEIVNSTVSTSGQPQFSFIPIIGNLYGVESSTNLLSNAWQTHILYLSSGGMITVTNYAAGSQAGFVRVLTKLFPPQNMNSGFSFLLRSSRVGMNILGELVDTQGISFPFRISGSTLNSPFGYTIPNDSELLPEGFLLNSIDIIRFSVPQKYQEYPSGTNITNSFSSGSFEFRLQNGIGPVAPPRSEMRDIQDFNFASYPWRNEETVESLIRIFLDRAGVPEAEQPNYRLFKVAAEDVPGIFEEYRGRKVDFGPVGIEKVGEFLAENLGSNRADQFETVWVGLEEPVSAPVVPVEGGVPAKKPAQRVGKPPIKIRLAPRDPHAGDVQKQVVASIKSRAVASSAAKAKPKSSTGLVLAITLGFFALIAAAVWYFSKDDEQTPPATAPPVAGQPARSELRSLTDGEITKISNEAISLWRDRVLGSVPAQDSELLVSPSTENSLVALIKPKTGKITANTIAEVIKDLRLRGWGLNALRVIPSQVIREKRLISKHYPRHYQVAILGSTALNDDEKKSVEAYLAQQGWEQPDAAQVYSAAQLINESGISARELMLLWKQAMAAGKVKKVGQGARAFRVGAVNFPKRDQFKHQFSGKTILVYNAFYPAVEENFSESENPTIAFWIKPIEGANAISAEQMKVAAGDTDPAVAAGVKPDSQGHLRTDQLNSLRARAYNHDPALELDPQVNFDVENNFIHMTDPADIAGWPVGSGEFQWFDDLISQVRRSELRWENPTKQKILVVGTGFVGATKAILQAIDFGHDVVALDVIKEKLDQLRAGELPFEAEYLPELLKEAIASGRLTFTQDYASALEGRKYIYLALPTPQSDSGEANTSYLESAVRTIAENLKPGEQKILIGKSTAPPKWTVEKLRQVADEVLAKRRVAGEDLKDAKIQFAWEPEFLREAKEVEDDRGVAGRLVIGAETRRIAEEVRSLYLNWDPSLNPPRREVPIILTDIASGPLVKYAANGYRALKISFINFISWLTEELGFDINEIADAVGLDPRVIRNFLTAGPGFGGSCFPKDLAAFIKITKELGVSSGIILDALAVNQVQIDRFVEKMESNLDGFKGKKIVLLGGAFKAGTSDTRESRAVIAAKRMIEAGASVIIVDPAAKEELEKVFRDYNQGANKPIAFYESVAGNYEAIFSEASALAVMTEWPEFKNIDFNQLRSLYHHGQKLPSFFDARNLFERQQMENLGFEYFDIGRGRKPFGVGDEDHRRAKADLVDWAREFFLVLRISYINIVAEVAEKLGANILDVQKGFGYDPVVFGYRPDKNGEIDYLDPGIGWGGHDLVDALRQMEAMAEASVPGLLSRFVTARSKYLKRFGILGQSGLEKTPFVGVSRDINQHQIQLHVEKIKKILGVDSLQGKTISILGVAYKKGTYSIEGSPSVDLIEALFKEGARVHMWDPEAAATAGVNNFLHENVIHGEIQSFLNPHDAMRGTDLQVVVHVDNGYEENVAHLVMDGRGNKVATRILDARHVFSDPQAFQRLGVEYHAIGVPLSVARSEARVITLQVGEHQDFDGFNFTLESIANGKATVKITSPTSEFAAKKRGTVFETNTQRDLAAGDLIWVENVSGKGPVARAVSLTANSIVIGSTRSEARAELSGTPYQTHEERLREYLMSVPVGGEVDYSRFEALSFDRRSSLFDEFAVFYLRDEKKYRRGLAVEKWDFNERESVSLPALPNIQAVSFPYDTRHFQIPLKAFSSTPFSFYFSDFGRRVEVSLKSDRSVILSIKSIAEKKEEGVIHLDSDNVYAQLNSAEGALRLSRVKRSWSNRTPELRFSLQNNNLVITHYPDTTNPRIFLDRGELSRFQSVARSEYREGPPIPLDELLGNPESVFLTGFMIVMLIMLFGQIRDQYLNNTRAQKIISAVEREFGGSTGAWRGDSFREEQKIYLAIDTSDPASDLIVTAPIYQSFFKIFDDQFAPVIATNYPASYFVVPEFSVERGFAREDGQISFWQGDQLVPLTNFPEKTFTRKSISQDPKRSGRRRSEMRENLFEIKNQNSQAVLAIAKIYGHLYPARSVNVRTNDPGDLAEMHVLFESHKVAQTFGSPLDMQSPWIRIQLADKKITKMIPQIRRAPEELPMTFSSTEPMKPFVDLLRQLAQEHPTRSRDLLDYSGRLEVAFQSRPKMREEEFSEVRLDARFVLGNPDHIASHEEIEKYHSRFQISKIEDRQVTLLVDSNSGRRFLSLVYGEPFDVAQDTDLRSFLPQIISITAKPDSDSTVTLTIVYEAVNDNPKDHYIKRLDAASSTKPARSETRVVVLKDVELTVNQIVETIAARLYAEGQVAEVKGGGEGSVFLVFVNEQGESFVGRSVAIHDGRIDSKTSLGAIAYQLLTQTLHFDRESFEVTEGLTPQSYFPAVVVKTRSEARRRTTKADKVVEAIVTEAAVISNTFPPYYRALKHFLSLSKDHKDRDKALEDLSVKREWFVQEMIAAAGKAQLRMVGGSTQVLFKKVVKPVIDEFISIKHLVQIEPIGANGIISEGEKIHLASLLLGALNTSETIAERFLNNLQRRRSEIRANVSANELREELAEVSMQMGDLNDEIRKIKDPKTDENYPKLQGRYKELDARRVEILIALDSSARSEMRGDSNRTFPIWLHRSGLSLILGGILLGSFSARLYYGIDSVSDLLPWASMLVGGFLIEEFWRLGFRVRQLSDDEVRKAKTAKSVLSGRSEMRMTINGGEYDPVKIVEVINALRRDLEAPEIQTGVPDGTLDLNRKFIWLTNYNRLRFAQGTTRSDFKDMGGFAVQLALESALLERFKVNKPTDVVLSHDPANGPIADYRYYLSWSVSDGADAESRSTAILDAARAWLDEKTAEAQQILNPPEPTTTKRSEMRWEESAQAVLDWKEENIGKWDEYLPESPFETRLESKVRSIYEKNKINEFSFEERRLFIEAVFGAKEHRGVLSGIQALLSSLDPKALKKLNEGSILSGKDYRRFGGVLARLEHLHPILEAHYIRLATYLLFDFWDHETRVLEISWLLDSIESEFNHMENESFPITAAMQDLHGGTRRALALVGFLMGLPANVYTKLHSVEDLEYELGLIGKSLEDFPGRIIGLNDKYDRGGDPVGSAKLVQKLTATGKGRPIVGNHDLWRAEGALGIHLLFRAIAEKEGHSSDYYEKDGAQKTHHPASWAEDAFPHEGWGVVELEQMNQSRFNRALAAVNHVLVLNQLEPFLALDLASIRSSESEALNRLKKEISKKRKDMIAGTISKDEFEAFQKAHPLPDVHGVVMEKLRAALAAYNDQIRAVNDAKHLDVPELQFSEVNLENYYRDPEIIERTLWELKNFRLFYVDILGNLHMHNIIPIDYKRGGFDVQYKGKRGLAAMELIARDIRFFFENLETIPDSQAFRQKMWEQIGEAITVVNGWYSDLDPQAKVPAIKRFVDEGKMEGLLGHAEDVPVDREVSGIFFWGHNERSKLLSPGGDLPPLPYAFLYPDLGTALFNIDGEMSEGYSDRGMIVTMGMKVNGKATGLRVWGFRKGSNIVEDLTFEDIPGMPDEQHAMLKHLHDDRGFLEWNRARLLKEMIKHLNILILSAENKKRSDADGSKLDHYRQLRMRMNSWLEQEDVSKAFTRRSESRSQKTDPIWLGLDSPTADWQRMNTAIWVYLDMKERREGNAAEDVIKRQIAEKLNQMGLGVGENDLNRIWGSVKATAVLDDPFQAGINSDHAFYFKEKLEQLLTASARRTGTIAILELFEAYEKAAEEWPLYALESRWPMLRAVAMMNKETQKALLEILSDSPKKFGRLRLTDTIFLMLGEELLTEKEYEAYISKWMKSHAPSLIGRDIYYVSPETWLLAGGLGRVGQYHTRGVRKLLAKQGRLLTIEPLYHYRIRPDGSQHPLDYSKLETPVLDLEDSYEFSVTVKGQQVSVIVKKGRTEDDIPVYLLDGGDFYTRALYKYGSQYGSADWKAFTEFFSRASLELIRRIEIEKQANQGDIYKAPVIWGNDGQSGLLPVYKRMLDKSHRVLRKAFVWFTTHTFANRGYFGWEDSFVRDAGLSQVPYSDLFVNRKNNAWDATSGGVNGADGVNGVAAAHRHEVSLKDPDATEVSISNGDDLNKSAAYFREVLVSLYPGADIWRPTGEQILKTKAEAIRRLNPKFKAKYGVELNPNAPVASYSGRKVHEKDGLERAFTAYNLRQLVLGGVNVAYFGNTQVEPDHSFEELKKQAQAINSEAERLEKETGKKLGRMIVATGWNLHDQVEILAITHIQVQDSNYKTGASEVTEANFSVNGGLNMGPAWTEGNIQKIGIVLDPKVPGSGNILIPRDSSPAAYLERLTQMTELFYKDPDHFGSYLETSVRLSRVVNAMLPASEYLLQFEAGVRQKDALSTLSSKIKKGVLRTYSSGAFKNTALARELREISKMSYADAAALYGERALASVAVAIAFLLPETLAEIKSWNFPGYGMLENYVAAPEHEVLFRDDAILRVHQTDHYGVIMFSRASKESGRVLTPAVRLESVAWDQQSRKTWAAGIENIERIVDPSNRAIYRVGDYSVAGKISHIYPKRPTGEEISKSHRLGVPTMPHDSPDANVRHEIAGAQLLFLEKEAPARSESRKGQEASLRELRSLINSRKLGERERAQAIQLEEKLNRAGWTLRALEDATRFVKQHSSRSENRQEIQLGKDQIVMGTFTDDFTIQINEDSYYKIWFRGHPHFGVKGVPKNEFLMQRFSVETNQAVGKVHYLVGGREVSPQLKNLASIPQSGPFFVLVEWKEDAAHFRLVGNNEKPLPVKWSGSVTELSMVKKPQPSKEDDEGDTEDRAEWTRPREGVSHQVLSGSQMKTAEFKGEFSVLFGKQHIRVWKQAGNKDNLIDGEYYFQRQAAAGKKPAGIYLLRKGTVMAVFPFDGGISYKEFSKVERGTKLYFTMKAEDKNDKSILTVQNREIHSEITVVWFLPRSEARQPARATEKEYSTLEEARQILVKWLEGIVPQKWLAGLRFEEAASTVTRFTSAVAFAGEVPMVLPSLLAEHQPNAAWQFARTELKVSAANAGRVGQVILHPQVAELIAANGRAAFEILKQFSNQAGSDIAPLVIFSAENNLKDQILKAMTNLRSGLTPTEKGEAGNLIKLLQIESVVSGSAEEAMNRYLAEYQKTWALAALLPNENLLDQIQSPLKMALAEKTVAAEDAVVFAKIAKALYQAALLGETDQIRYLSENLSGASKTARGWVVSLKTLIDALVLTRELIATSA